MLLCLVAACGHNENPIFHLNLFTQAIPGEDPLDGVSKIDIALDDGSHSWTIDGQASVDSFGPLNDGQAHRLRLEGTAADGQRLSWGFGSPLRLNGGARKATVFFTGDHSAVAYAVPTLIDPLTGLQPTGIPVSLKVGPATVYIGYNLHHLYVEMQVADERVVPNDGDWWDGDLAVVVLDGNGDSQEQERGFDDIAIAAGAARFVEIWKPQSAAGPIIHNFRPTDSGYDVFIAIPLASLSDNFSPGPDRVMAVGIEIQDDDGVQPVTDCWPADWQPNPAGEPPRSYFAYGAGALALKTRLLDAGLVGLNEVGFEKGIDDFLDSGAVALHRVPQAGEDGCDLYAVRDGSALLLALSTDDEFFCAQDRSDGQRPEILEDDAIEVLIGVSASPGVVTTYRALFSLSGATAFDRLDGQPWSPHEIYFRIDLNGPSPQNDCQHGAGYTFKVRIPWNELGFLDKPPAPEALFAFDLVVYDNDRGARSVAAFSPLGPTEETQALGELRMFDY
ncbi:MAG TPA: hypothetical protein VM425_19975 [Myxococcota bacterium]|nr:hypothetical protein [Myxococcota bacterium]